jgi:hypothetical protein
MRIDNVRIFVAPNFGVKQALLSALTTVVKNEVKLTHYEVGSGHIRLTAMFNAEYETGDQGNKVKKQLVGTIWHHSELDSIGDMVLPYIDIEYQEVA